ncbi:MAG: site-specific integrase [Candidatus Magasanikbacteria bacterium]
MPQAKYKLCHWTNLLIQKRNRAIYSTLKNSGVRKGELLGLHLCDVDLNTDTLTVRGNTSKSKLTRQIPINYELHSKLEDYIKERKANNCTAIELWVSEKDHSKGLTAAGLLHMLDKIRKNSGMKFHLHQFRHTFATNLVKQRIDTPTLMYLMGHTDIRMTAVYTRNMPISHARQFVSKI